MGQAIPPITFSEETIVEIEETLDLKLSSTRRELLKRILLEWGRTDLVEHLSRVSRPILRKRVNRVKKVKKPARKLSKALSALEDDDLGGLLWRGHYVSRTEYQRQSVSGWWKHLNLLLTLLTLSRKASGHLRGHALPPLQPILCFKTPRRSLSG
jgi:hypothetical protein